VAYSRRLPLRVTALTLGHRLELVSDDSQFCTFDATSPIQRSDRLGPLVPAACRGWFHIRILNDTGQSDAHHEPITKTKHFCCLQASTLDHSPIALRGNSATGFAPSLRLAQVSSSRNELCDLKTPGGDGDNLGHSATRSPGQSLRNRMRFGPFGHEHRSRRCRAQ